jgi:hypothetical protein
MYNRIQRRLENSNLAIGEFPDVVAKKIRKAVMEGEDCDSTGLNELREIRNSKQIAALEELWSLNKNVTESELFRENLIKICHKYFIKVGTEFGGIVKVFETLQGTRYNLTSKSGLPESISLKSKIWDYITYDNLSLEIVRDTANRPAYFTTEKDGNIINLKHSSIAKIILNQELEESDILDRYPNTLPNSKDITLSYALDIDIPSAPNYWID